jgi:HEAT repeat protein
MGVLMAADKFWPQGVKSTHRQGGRYGIQNFTWVTQVTYRGGKINLFVSSGLEIKGEGRKKQEVNPVNPKKKTTRTVPKSTVSKSVDQQKGQDWIEEATPSLESLIFALSNHDDVARVKARHFLVTMGKAAVPSLTEAMKSKKDLTRWEAAKTLGEIGDPQSAPVLVKALEDEEFDVRWLAAIGLIGMNIRGLKPLLHALMEQGDSIWVREGAHHVMHDLAKGELRKYLAPVLVALENTDTAAEVHTAALHALEMLDKDHKISDAWRHDIP